MSQDSHPNHMPPPAHPTPPAPQPPAAPETEVSFDQAPEQENLGNEPRSAPKEETARDIIDILQPKSAPKMWTLGPEDMRRDYVQRPLAFIAKMQWFALVGDVLDRALGGPNGMSLNSLFNAPQRGVSGLTMEDFRDADTFVQAVGKLLHVAPKFLLDSYCIWLQVPDYEWDIAQTLMKLPAEEGGLTDDAGLEIIEVFIDQNYDALHDFFTRRLTVLQKRVQARIEANRD